MCQATGVSRAGFYRDWQERKPQDAEMIIRDEVQKAALRYRRYGYRRVLEVVRRSASPWANGWSDGSCAPTTY